MANMSYDGNVNIYVHNDLGTGVENLFKIHEYLTKMNRREGISYVCLSIFLLSVCCLEARVNFLGHARVRAKWNERAQLVDKIKVLLKLCGAVADWNKRPFISVTSAISMRNSIAHGKPKEQFLVGSGDVEEEIWKKFDPKGEWIDFCELEKINDIWSDFNEIWYFMKKELKISDYESLTHGAYTIESI